MPYRVVVDRKDGNRVEISEIRPGPTPQIGSEVIASIEGKPLRAIVFGIRKVPSKSPGTSVETIDHVDAREI